MTAVEPVTAATPRDVEEAAGRFARFARRTPLVDGPDLAELCGAAAVHAKLENLNLGGSFKIRGAFTALTRAPLDVVRRGVVTYSSGNHGKAVTIVASHLGATATVFVPHDLSTAKRDAMLAAGSRLRYYDRHVEDRHALALAHTREVGGIFVPPYDHRDVILGQGTATWEALAEVPDVDLVVAPVGGGGLLAGTAIAADSRRGAGGRIAIGVETDRAPAGSLSLAQDERVTTPPPRTIADAMRKTSLGALTWSVIRQRVTDIETVTDDEIADAADWVLDRWGLAIEPTSAAPVAWLLRRPAEVAGRTVLLIVSGRK